MAKNEPRSRLAQLVRRHDRDRFLATLFAPAGRREDLFALYAFNHEVAKTREVVSEPMLGRIRLQWWRDTLAAIYEGGEPRQHEIVQPLAAAIARHQLTREHLEAVIGAREADLENEGPASLAALEAYAEATSGRLVWLALEVLGDKSAAARTAGTEAGIAYALAGLLRAVPFHARQKRLMLPRDACAAAGLAPERDLFELRSSPALRAVSASVAMAAERHLAAARAQRAAVPRQALPALLPAALAGADLARLKRSGYDPFDRRVAAPDGGRSWRLALAGLMHRY